VRDGFAAERELSLCEHEAAILDLGLPRLHGMQVLKELRSKKITTPVMILTAQDTLQLKIEGLDRGADDYLVKPVDLMELAARLRALVRRSHGLVESVLQLGCLRIELDARLVYWNDRVVEISTREFDLLKVLALSAGRVMTRSQVETQLYAWGQEVNSNAIEVHVSNLRRKLAPQVIETLRGVGYRMPKNVIAEKL
jgi:two-component system OmpR family response regulator/two-component system response regulator QseB